MAAPFEEMPVPRLVTARRTAEVRLPAVTLVNATILWGGGIYTIAGPTSITPPRVIYNTRRAQEPATRACETQEGAELRTGRNEYYYHGFGLEFAIGPPRGPVAV